MKFQIHCYNFICCLIPGQCPNLSVLILPISIDQYSGIPIIYVVDVSLYEQPEGGDTAQKDFHYEFLQ